jgi:hypothetical protein
MLTNIQIQKAAPAAKPIRLFDGGGLYLEISPTGGKLWRFKYRFDGKEKRLALGKYPEISLANARKRREAARELLANGVDPSEDKKAKRAERVARLENNFEAVAREWFEKNSPNWAHTHADKIIKRLENDVFPWLGKRPIADITAPEFLKVLRRIEERGAVDTAHRAHQNCGQVMRYAVATGRAVRDPTGDLRGSLPAPKHRHFAALTEPVQVAGLLRAMDAFERTSRRAASRPVCRSGGRQGFPSKRVDPFAAGTAPVSEAMHGRLPCSMLRPRALSGAYIVFVPRMITVCAPKP